MAAGVPSPQVPQNLPALGSLVLPKDEDQAYTVLLSLSKGSASSVFIAKKGREEGRIEDVTK